jgi:chorismate mutase
MTKELPEGIEELRRLIDQMDLELVQLLNRRARCAVEIGKLKGRAGLPVQDPDREESIFLRAGAATKGPLTPKALGRLFERILAESRRLEQRSIDAEIRGAHEEEGV